MKLADYRKKRDQARTNEPFGEDPRGDVGPTREGAFVIHLHDATRRHYDLRLEVGGVLLSFAVPRGPSLDPSVRHLAVQTEDHPIEYLDFEEVIPEKSYGAGPMIVWDRGRVRYLETSAEGGLERGKIDFELDGFKARGRYGLVRIKGEPMNWLLLKKTDAFANPKRDLVADSPRSVLSGLTVEELLRRDALGRAVEEAAAAMGAPEGALAAKKLVPMLCTAGGDAPAASPEWVYELKLDGVRALAIKEGEQVYLGGRKLRETTLTYPEVARAVRSLAASRAVIDGEVVALDPASGQPSFHRLAQRMHLTRAHEVKHTMVTVPVIYVAFDLLAVGDRVLVDLPLVQRRKLLAQLIPGPGILRVLDLLPGDARPLLALCEQRGLEGVVAKLAASRYVPGPRRTGDWVKIKRERDDDFVVVGYTRGEGARERLGALDVAAYVGDRLVNRGKVGSGLDDASIDRLLALLAPLARETPAGKGDLAPAPRGRTHVSPEIVVRVHFAGFSENDAQIRHGVFGGIRDDIDPKECTAAPGGEDGGNAEAPKGKKSAPVGPAPDAIPAPDLPTNREPEEPPQKVAITNRHKVLWPEEGYTKSDLFAYYEAIAPAMLPHLHDRPIALVRYPDGIAGKSFYQWNVPPGLPSWVKTFRLRDEEKGSVEVFLVNDARTLLYVANLAAIPIHVLASRAGSLDRPDYLTVDFDVELATLRDGIALALSLRELLDRIGLAGFPKTSGQSGLHVLVPLGPGIGHATARALVDLLGRLLVRKHPDIATMERMIHKRGARVYIDTGQTGPTRTIVAPYSARAKKGAGVSAPLRWSEVSAGLDPSRFTIKTVPARFEELGDPMAGLYAARPDVHAAAAALAALVQGV
jgi:bifunctional non-homologous end joining protein LigD